MASRVRAKTHATNRPDGRRTDCSFTGMKFFGLFSLALTLGLVGCANSSPISRIDANRGKYESWPLDVQQAVLNREAIKGMTPEQVEMALGKPAEVITRSATEDEQIWVYRKGGGMGGALKNMPISIGTGIGGVGVGTTVGGNGRGSTPEETEIVFRNGVVSRGGQAP